jgi:hypothetical protein
MIGFVMEKCLNGKTENVDIYTPVAVEAGIFLPVTIQT